MFFLECLIRFIHCTAVIMSMMSLDSYTAWKLIPWTKRVEFFASSIESMKKKQLVFFKTGDSYCTLTCYSKNKRYVASTKIGDRTCVFCKPV